MDERAKGPQMRVGFFNSNSEPFGRSEIRWPMALVHVLFDDKGLVTRRYPRRLLTSIRAVTSALDGWAPKQSR